MDWYGVIKENSLFLISILLFIILFVQPRNVTQQKLFKIDNEPMLVKVSSYPVYFGKSQKFNVIYTAQADINRTFQIIAPLMVEVDLSDELVIKGNLITDINDFEKVKGITGKFIYPQIISQKEGRGIFNTISKFRSQLLNEINSNWHGQDASLLAGLLIGADYDYSTYLLEQFKLTMTMHLIVVSGFNVGLVHRIVMSLAPLIGRRKTYLVSMIILIFYFFLVGFDNIPCQRAMLICLFIILFKLYERRVSSFQLWGLCLLCILLLNPAIVNDIGLQLSFSASLGLLLFGLFRKRLKLNWIAEGMAVNILCNLITLPVLIRLNNYPSLNSLIANIFVGPVIPVAMGFAILGLILEIVLPQLSILFIRSADMALQAVFLIISIASTI